MTRDVRDQLQNGLTGAYTLERELGGCGMARVFVAGEVATVTRAAIDPAPLPTLGRGVGAHAAVSPGGRSLTCCG